MFFFLLFFCALLGGGYYCSGRLNAQMELTAVVSQIVRFPSFVLRVSRAFSHENLRSSYRFFESLGYSQCNSKDYHN
ncbi:hypothetical protein CPC08DRAFT_411152 [Agrocybe pediades]|nr:hypothetical protein CPC08DRAFT_411152 [Agrocybe pediades]